MIPLWAAALIGLGGVALGVLGAVAMAMAAGVYALRRALW